MPSFERESGRIVIAGASSLLGAELRSLLEESRFAGADFRLVDEEIAAGVLTEAGGEPAVIQPVEAETFERASKIFFAGSPEFTIANLRAARKTSAKVMDLSGATAAQDGTVSWFPKLDALLDREFPGGAGSYAVPSAGGMMASALSLGLHKVGVSRMVVFCFQPVSDVGKAGIEELESQTGQLLSFQGVGQPVFDTQVAFNLLDRYGPESKHRLSAIRERLAAEVKGCVGGNSIFPALQIIQAPVFYGTAFAAWAEIAPETSLAQVIEACENAGFAIDSSAATGPSNVSVAGEKIAHLAKPEKDASRAGTWWFWGAADNIRLPAANAVRLAEMFS
ncbi:MAG TPA: Asd/ArgC dimerization domain-containing protein [Candidatus Acidoferrum sp.]|nr:Asd/ArgC dimerization domain-containing protein [Candidatus Acidoferrum sp.]